MTSEQKARDSIDALLVQVGWYICNAANANLHAGDGAVKDVASREFPVNNGFGIADYLLYVNAKACGVIEAKKEGATLIGLEIHFTNGLNPEPLARDVFAFFRPELLVQWLANIPAAAGPVANRLRALWEFLPGELALSPAHICPV